jgi:hypothetical protein
MMTAVTVCINNKEMSVHKSNSDYAVFKRASYRAELGHNLMKVTVCV